MIQSELNIYRINEKLSILGQQQSGSIESCIQKCKTIYEHCIKLSYAPGIAKSLNLWAKFESINNDMKVAQNLLERAYEYCKEEESDIRYEVLVNMSSCYIKQFQINEAATILTVAIKELNKTTRYDLLCNAYYNFGELNKRIGYYDDAQKNYERILRFSDDGKVSKAMISKVYLALSEIGLLKGEKIVNIKSIFEDPLDIDKPYLKVYRYYVMGQYYLSIGKQENALKVFKTAVEIKDVKGEKWYVFLALKAIIEHELSSGDTSQALLMYNYYNDLYNFSKTSFVMLNSLLLQAQILHKKGHYKEGSQILYDYIHLSSDLFMNQAGESLSQSLKYHTLLEETKNHKLNSVTDALTGLGNRRGFNQQLERLIGKYKTSVDSLKLSLLLLDLDFFKQYNDLIGHLKGDELLKAIGIILLKVQKEHDVHVFRYGGDEFIIIGLCKNDESYYELAETIRLSIESLGIEKAKENDNKVKAVTVSIGLLEMVAGQNISKEKLISQVDKALYTSKKENRNRITVMTI